MLKLQTVLEDGVAVTVRFDVRLEGAYAHPVCLLQIDDDSDGVSVGLVATLDLDETEAVCTILRSHIDKARAREKSDAAWQSGARPRSPNLSWLMLEEALGSDGDPPAPEVAEPAPASVPMTREPRDE